MKKFYLLILVLTIFIQPVLSQTQTATNASKLDNQMISGKFDRKSITILPLTLTTAGNYYNELLNGVNQIPPSGRFDNNYINKDALNKAQKLFLNSKLTNFDFETNKDILIKALKESGALTEIIKSTSNMDSLYARVLRSKRRVVTSALEDMKVRTPSVKDVMNLISNTYIAIPLLKTIETKDNSTNAKGTLIWLNVDISNVTDWDGTVPKIEQVQLKLVNQKESSISSEFIDMSGDFFTSNKDEKDLPKETKAARNFGKALINMAMTMNEFQVRATIQDVEDDIRIDIGKREGVYLDQGYKVFEQRLDPNGTVYSQYMGFVRVDNVADNTEKYDALSGCYTIIPGGFEAGHIITSHDQSFDILIRPQYKQVFIPKEFGAYTPILHNQPKGVFKSDITEVYNAELAIMFNAARLLNTTQFFIGLSGFIGLPNSTKEDVTGLTINTPLVYGANLALQKKFWLYRTALSFELQAGAQTLALTGTVKDYLNKDLDWEYNTGWNISIGGSVGFEFAISPDVNLGLEAGYTYVMLPSEVKVKVGTVERTFKKDEMISLGGYDYWKLNKLDDVQLGGLKVGLKLNFSLPPLF